MKRLLLFITVFLSLVRPATAYEVVVLKSSDAAPYTITARAFEEEFYHRVPARGLKAIVPHRFRELVLESYGGNGEVAEQLNPPPDLILALGGRALLAARQYQDVPVVYCLVVNPEKIAAGSRHITGINLTIPPALQFAEVEKVLPGVRRVGVIYDPQNSAELVSRAVNNLSGLDFVALEAESAKKVPGLLDSLRGRVDLLWMIPDATVVNGKTLKSYFLFSFRNKVPVLTFSERYLKPGAAVSVSFDLESMGRSAAEQAGLILGGIPVAQVPPREVTRVKTRLNHTIMNKLGIAVGGGKP